MKKTVVFLFLIASVALTAQNDKNVFKFKAETLNYGTIEQNSNGKRSFVFTNNGKTPITISKIKVSCGCTIATKPEKPILPGETAKIGVKYATNRLGKFSKTIIVTSSASKKPKTLRIKGEVIPI